MPLPGPQAELSVGCQAGKCRWVSLKRVLFSPQIHSFSQTGRKLGK